jgi:hypothetical protein
MSCCFLTDRTRGIAYGKILTKASNSVVQLMTSEKALAEIRDFGTANLSFVTTFVLDLEVWGGTWAEVEMALQALTEMYPSARRVILAGKASSHLIPVLIQESVYNIVLESKDEEGLARQLARCFSEHGMTKSEAEALMGLREQEIQEPMPEACQDTANIPKKSGLMANQAEHQEFASPQPTAVPATPTRQGPIYVLDHGKGRLRRKSSGKQHQQISVAVAGICRHSGTTHQCFLIASALKSAGYRVCILEANNHKSLAQMAELYEKGDKRKDAAGHITVKGIDLFYGFFFSEVAAKGYDFFIFDCGVFSELPAESFLTKNVKIIVGGGKDWEVHMYASVYEHFRQYLDLYFIVNHATREEQQYLKELLSPYKNRAFFSEWSPNIFEVVNMEIYAKIFSGFLDFDRNGGQASSSYVEMAGKSEEEPGAVKKAWNALIRNFRS